MIRMPASSAWRGPENRTGRSSRRISPSYSVRAPARIFIRVLLPAPFSPQRAWTSPAVAMSDTSRSARTPPKFLPMCRISSRGGSATSAAARATRSRSAGLGPWLMGGAIRQWHGVMDLPGDLDEPDRGIKVLADRVLLQRLDLGHGHARGAEARQGVLDQLPAQAPAPRLGADDQVVDPADERLGVALHGDVPDHRAGLIVLGDGQLGTQPVDVPVDVARLAPPPIPTGDRSESPLDVVIDRHALERRDGQLADRR